MSERSVAEQARQRLQGAHTRAYYGSAQFDRDVQTVCTALEASEKEVAELRDSYAALADEKRSVESQALKAQALDGKIADYVRVTKPLIARLVGEVGECDCNGHAVRFSAEEAESAAVALAALSPYGEGE